MKHLLSLLLALCMLLSLCSGMALAAPAEAPRVLTDEDYALTDQVWAEIRALEQELKERNATRDQRIAAVADLVRNSVNYVEGSLEMDLDNLTWNTDQGIACMYPYDKDEEADRQGKPAPILPENLENYTHVSYAKKGYPSAVDIYVLGPWYAYDNSFNDNYGVGYYREFADKLSQASGGQYFVYRNTDVTIDVIADCLEKGAMVMIDSHGTYAYKSGRYRNYLRLSTGTGITNADYNNGNVYYDGGYSHGPAYMVTGTAITNHMEKDAPNSFVWLGICSGMRYESMFKPLMERGVESCMGYSRTISFEWDRYWLSAFSAALCEGKTVAEAAAAMKSKYGKWDRNTEYSYNTYDKAVDAGKAFPIFVSKEDSYPSSVTDEEYPMDLQNYQTVKSTWRLFGQEFTVTFEDGSGKVLQSQKVTAGSSVSYTGATPTKAYDTTNHYSFSGWVTKDGKTANLSSITADTVFYASFKATAHSYKETVISAGSCTAAGVVRYTCTACSYSYDASSSAAGHKAVTDKGYAATCTTDGLTDGSHCSVCNAVLEAQNVIPATGHSPVTDKGYAPGCTTPGMTDGSHCDLCNTVIAQQTVIPPTGHTEVVTPGRPAGCVSSGLTDGITCSVCNAVIQAQQPIARLGHDYLYTDNGDGTHNGICRRCNKTQNNKPHGFDSGICTDCGATEFTAPEVDEAITLRHSLNLASDISINYAVEAALLNSYDRFYLVCDIPVYEGNTRTGTNSVEVQPVLNGNYYYFTLTGITAVQIGDMVDATLHMEQNGVSFVSKVDSYSVASYAYAQMNKSNSSKALKSLCAELLRYGAMAQTYKNYRTNDPVDLNMTLDQLLLLSDLNAVTFANNNEEKNDLSNPSVTWIGKSLDLNSKVTLKYIFNPASFSGNPADLSLRVSFLNVKGETVNYTVTGAKVYNAAQGWYAFDLDSLLAAELRSVVSAAIYNGSTRVSKTMVYSPDTYGNGKSGALLDLCKALFAYSDTAKAFFANN